MKMANDRKVYLHLSDIHHKEEEINSGVDLDVDIRNEMLQDLRRLKDTAFEQLDGILLTGDIAYAGKETEFKSARDWLNTIQTEFDFPESNVWCVPGNHDIDRQTIKESRCRQNIRNEIRKGGETNAAEELHSILTDAAAKDIMIGPLRAYNEHFAVGFGCTTEFPKLSWSKAVPIGNLYKVIFTGLNSAVISDHCDDVDTGRLVLGLHQVQALKREERRIHVSLCHHPTGWLFDRTDTERFLNSRATLQLFGHEHKTNIIANRNYVQVYAGALHPNRNDKEWDPCFNLIEIGVDDDNPVVQIRIWPRRWDHDETKFKAAHTEDGSGVETFTIPIFDPLNFETHKACDEVINERNNSGVEQLAFSDETVQIEEEPAPRDIVLHFFTKNTMTQRMRIALELGLYRDEDINLGIAEFGRRVFLRARQEGKMDKLKAAIYRNDN